MAPVSRSCGAISCRLWRGWVLSWLIPRAKPSSSTDQRKEWSRHTEKATFAWLFFKDSTTRSMSWGEVNGEVHCKNTTVSGCRPCCSRVSTACSKADSDVAVSPEISGGRSITCAPASSAVDAIRWQSVLTMTRSTSFAAEAARIVLATKGSPPTSCRFFPATPLEPPRAGIMATVACKRYQAA